MSWMITDGKIHNLFLTGEQLYYWFINSYYVFFYIIYVFALQSSDICDLRVWNKCNCITIFHKQFLPNICIYACNWRLEMYFSKPWAVEDIKKLWKTINYFFGETKYFLFSTQIKAYVTIWFTEPNIHF